MSIMTFAGKDRLAGRLTEHALLRLSWEAEYFGVGMMEALAEMHPRHADTLTACARMEWFNVGADKLEELGGIPKIPSTTGTEEHTHETR